MLEKPPYGSECNGCGGCCEDQLCPLAVAVFPTWRAPCPALESSAGGVKTCGLINDPMRYAPVRIAVKGRPGLSKSAAVLCGAGIGCDAIAPNEVVDPSERLKFQRSAKASFSKTEIRKARGWWGV